MNNSYEPMQTQTQIQGSIPGEERAYKFLESIAQKNSVSNISIQRRIMTIKTQLQKEKQVRRKVKHTIKEKYLQLQNIQRQIDSLTKEISRLAN